MFRRRRKIADKRLLASSCPPVLLSVRMEQIEPNATNFHEIWSSRIFRKIVEKIQISWKSDKNNGYFMWRTLYIFYNGSS